MELRKYKEAIRQLIFRHDLARNIDSNGGGGANYEGFAKNFTEFKNKELYINGI